MGNLGQDIRLGVRTAPGAQSRTVVASIFRKTVALVALRCDR